MCARPSEILADRIRVELSLLGWLTGESQVTEVCALVCTCAGWCVIRVQHAGWSPRVKVSCGRRNGTDTPWTPHPVLPQTHQLPRVPAKRLRLERP